MIVIRMTRVGKRKQPTFRFVVQEKHRDPWGKAFEIVGHYNPRTKEKIFKEDRIKEWIAKGAQPSDTVHNLLVDAKIISGAKLKNAVMPKKAAAAPEAKVEEKSEAKTEEKPA